jgi:hypothetical protein
MTSSTAATTTTPFQNLKSRIVMIGKHRTSKSFPPSHLIPLWLIGGSMTVFIPITIFTVSRIVNRDNDDDDNNNNNDEANNNNQTNSPWWFFDFLSSSGDPRRDGTSPMLIATYLWSLLIFFTLLWYGYLSIRKNILMMPTKNTLTAQEPSYSAATTTTTTGTALMHDHYQQEQHNGNDSYHGIIVALILFTNYSILSMFLFVGMEGTISLEGPEMEQYGFCGQFGIVMYLTSMFWIIFSMIFVLLFRRYQKLKNVTFIDIEPSDYRISTTQKDHSIENTTTKMKYNQDGDDDDEFHYKVCDTKYSV